jgi:tellurite resistance protein TerC
VNANEVLFFGIFIVLIAGILLFDLGVFNKTSHEISYKESLIWSAIWVGLSMGFFILLKTHGDLIHGPTSIEDVKALVSRFGHPLDVTGMTDAQAISAYRTNLSLEFLTGYLIEYSLSVDNVFVMILIFTAFGIEKRYYKRILFWGITGAIIMRFVFIFLSSALIQRFEWILLFFGGLLVVTGIQMFRNRNKEEKMDTARHPVVRFTSKYFKVDAEYKGQKFWIKKHGKLYMTPIFIVLLIIEFTDVIFAVDSVPAIFAITKDPFIVFFSNIFAIIGLRSLFFLVSNVMSKFHYLKEGLSVLLTFIGVKMLTHHWFDDIGFTTTHSLLVVLSILAISIVASMIFPKKNQHISTSAH